MYENIALFQEIQGAVINLIPSGEHLAPIGYQMQPPI